MNEEYESSEELNEEEMIEAKLKGALKKLLQEDTIAKVRKFFNVEGQNAVSICFPASSAKKNILHFIINVDVPTIFDAAKIAYDIQGELGYEEFNGVNVQLRKTYKDSAFGEVFLDATAFSQENWKNVVSFLNKHYPEYLKDYKSQLTASQEMGEIGIFKSPILGSPKAIGQDKKQSSSKEASSEDTSPRVNVVECQETAGGKTTFKMEVVVEVSGKVEPKDMEDRVRLLLGKGLVESSVKKSNK